MATYREDGTPITSTTGEPLYREDGTRVYPADTTGAYRDDRRVAEPVVVQRRSGGFLIGLLLVAAIIIALLFFTGFWRANVTQSGALPKISVNATDGTLPKVNLQSKSIVIGSKQETVAVPTVGVKDKHDADN